MPITPEEFLENVDSLVSLPDVCFRVNEMADDPTCSAAEISQTIAQDPNLTTQLLRIANSPYYGFPSRVETISRAISVIGTQDLRDLVVSASVINAFSAEKNELIDLKEYWAHSLFTGFVARQLGNRTRTRVLCKERLFVAGLLHDVGQLVMSMKIPEVMRIIMQRAKAHVEPFYEVERLVFGIGHGEIGEALAKKWHLPASIQTTMRYHHEPAKAEDHELEVSIVHIANAMAHLAGISGLGSKENLSISSDAWKITGLNKKIVLAATDMAKIEFENSVSAFVPFEQVSNS